MFVFLINRDAHLLAFLAHSALWPNSKPFQVYFLYFSQRARIIPSPMIDLEDETERASNKKFRVASVRVGENLKMTYKPVARYFVLTSRPRSRVGVALAIDS